MYKVAVVGHSLVPPHIPSPENTEVRSFRAPGATTTSIVNHAAYRAARRWHHHHTILYVGGNDILPNQPHITPLSLATNIVALAEAFLGRVNHVTVVMIEPRYLMDYVETNPKKRAKKAQRQGRLTAQSFKSYAESVNAKVKRKLKYHGDRITFCEHGSKYFGPYQLPDGVHWNVQGQQKQINSYIARIIEQRDRYFEVTRIGAFLRHAEAQAAQN